MLMKRVLRGSTVAGLAFVIAGSAVEEVSICPAENFSSDEEGEPRRYRPTHHRTFSRFLIESPNNRQGECNERSHW